MAGLPGLREALAEKVQSLYQVNIHPEHEITITPGGTYSIFTSLATILEKGDEVIVLEPCYDSYIPNIEVQGATAVCIPLRYPDFSVDWPKVREAFHEGIKAIVINTPHNPTGYVWTESDMQELLSLSRTYSFYIISDEVYEHITFDNKKHLSILQYPELYERSFVTFSFGKVFHTTGWKMGYCIAPEPLMKEFRKYHQFLSFSCNTPIQVAFSQFLQRKNEYLNLPVFFQKKRDLFLDLIKDLPFTLHQKTSGSYFQTLGYAAFSDLNDKEFAVWLTKEIGVAVIPVSAFYRNGKDDKVVRFCFGKKDETLVIAAERLRKLA
jgi:methionine aminotransferase